VRQLFPAAVTDPDVNVRYAYPDGSAGRPWVRGNMVESVDGAAAVDGRSGGLSGSADKQIFRVLRSQADVVVAGSGTVRDEHYRPAQTSAMVPGLRAGRAATPPIAVVTGTLDLDLSASLFTEAPADARTIIITTEKAPPDRRETAAKTADVIVAGTDSVDLGTAVDALAQRGLHRILCEGGPHLLAQFAAAGRLDELCVTISPLLAAGDSGRILAGPALPDGLSLTLGHVLEDQGFLLCRYLTEQAG
jgi:riboflavin biosynthesis pyrimidine reductase